MLACWWHCNQFKQKSAFVLRCVRVRASVHCNQVCLLVCTVIRCSACRRRFPDSGSDLVRATNLGSSLLTLVCVVLTQVGTKQSTQTINQSGQVKATSLGCSLLTLVSSPGGHQGQVVTWASNSTIETHCKESVWVCEVLLPLVCVVLMCV